VTLGSLEIELNAYAEVKKCRAEIISFYI
jgi:hypothetical protein